MDLDDPAAVAYIEDGVRSWPVGRMQTWAFLVANVPLADAQRFAWDGHTLLAHAAEGAAALAARIAADMQLDRASAQALARCAVDRHEFRITEQVGEGTLRLACE